MSARLGRAAGGADPELEEGWVAEEVRAEFPELRLRSLAVAARDGRSTAGVRRRLRLLSDRFRGPHALLLRTEPVPAAYRVFFRHVGLDPDVARTPVEAAALERLVRGGLRARGRVQDALLVALVETGVPVGALDAARVAPPLGIAPDRDGRLGVADADGPVAPLFDPPGAERGVTKATRELLLYVVQVPGVPAIFVEEAVWLVLAALADAD